MHGDKCVYMRDIGELLPPQDKMVHLSVDSGLGPVSKKSSPYINENKSMFNSATNGPKWILDLNHILAVCLL